MPPPPEVRHHAAQQGIARHTGLALTGLLLALPDPETQEAMNSYHEQAQRIVSAGQVVAARFAIAYLASVSPPKRKAAAATVERALAGIAVDASSPVTHAPVLRLWRLVGEGEDLPVARQLAGSYANGLASQDLAVAERGGLKEGARAGGRKIKGWRKVLSSNPCAWCQKIATETSGRYHGPDTVPFHARDHCSVAPVFFND